MAETILLTDAALLSQSGNLLKPYLEVRVAENVPYHEDFVTAFQTATTLIGSVLNKPTFLSVIVGSPPFEIAVRHHKLLFEQHESAAATHLNGVIFLNFGNLSRYSLEMMTAGILEEFVHGTMNIKEELLARSVVSCLYQEVSPTQIGYELRREKTSLLTLQLPQKPPQI